MRGDYFFLLLLYSLDCVTLRLGYLYLNVSFVIVFSYLRYDISRSEIVEEKKNNRTRTVRVGQSKTFTTEQIPNTDFRYFRSALRNVPKQRETALWNIRQYSDFPDAIRYQRPVTMLVIGAIFRVEKLLIVTKWKKGNKKGGRKAVIH